MLKVNIISALNFNREGRVKLNSAVQLIETVVNSTAFKARVLRHQFNRKLEFYYNQKLSNEQIYNLLISGKEINSRSQYKEMDFRLSISDTCPDVAIGITFNRSRTETCRCKLANMSDSEYAGHLVHEWCHYLGFTHTSFRPPNRHFTVPYAIGYLVGDLAGAVSVKVNNEKLRELNSLLESKEKDKLSDSIFIDEVVEGMEESNEICVDSINMQYQISK